MNMRAILLMVAAMGLAACQIDAPASQAQSGAVAERANAPETLTAAIPTDACWARDTLPAITEPAEVTDANGQRRPMLRVLRPAEERMFAVPCPDQMGDDFIATLQRALIVRGLLSGPVTGHYDAATIEAVRRYQAPQGLDSGTLSLQAAQQMGLVVVPQPGR